jgi:5'-nucleotidase
MVILIDMDNVIVDFDGCITNIFKRRYPDRDYIPVENLPNFYIKKSYPLESKGLIEEIYLEKGFFRSLLPVPGSLESISYIQSKIDEVFICTSPITKNPYCMQEKYDWVKENIGDEWTKKIVITKDKTVVHGDILIDDKPYVNGAIKPSWEHILYDRSYNLNVPNKKRLTWNNFKEVISSL